MDDQTDFRTFWDRMMGYKYEVNAWDHAIGSDRWYWLKIYEGNNLFKALYCMWWAKRNGWLCMKFEWRPEN